METVIADAGPLVAYINREERHHLWARNEFSRIDQPLLTCDAALSEAFFLLQNAAQGTEALLRLLERGLVLSVFNLTDELPAVVELIRRYQDIPMSFADACLVRMAELHRNSKVFTLDGDFQIYRKNRRQTIPLIYCD